MFRRQPKILKAEPLVDEDFINEVGTVIDKLSLEEPLACRATSLRDIGGLSYRRAAAELGIPKDDVRQQVSVGRRAIANVLYGELPQDPDSLRAIISQA